MNYGLFDFGAQLEVTNYNDVMLRLTEQWEKNWGFKKFVGFREDGTQIWVEQNDILLDLENSWMKQYRNIHNLDVVELKVFYNIKKGIKGISFEDACARTENWASEKLAELLKE